MQALLLPLLLMPLALPAQAPAAKTSAPAATNATPAGPSAATRAEIAAVIGREFGPKFKILEQFDPLLMDLDGDGKEDLVVVVTGSAVEGEAAGHDVKLLTPYMESFGYGDARVFMEANTEVMTRYLAVVHDWRAGKVGAKLLFVGTPVEKLTSGFILTRKKKKVAAIETLDRTGVWGATFFDGKKYRWQAIGMEADVSDFPAAESPR